MKKTLISAAAALLFTAGSAFAADVSMPEAYDWTGVYVGLNAGYAGGGQDDVGVSTYGNVGDLTVNGFFGGVQAGYNWQQDWLVLGLEGDIQGMNIDDSDSQGGWKSESEVDYFGTLRGRAGLAFDNVLLYGTGGLAFGTLDYNVHNIAEDVHINDNFSKLGYALGAGVEWGIDDTWSVKGEYLYVNFGKKKLSDGAISTFATPDFHSVRLGINYRF